MVGDVVQGGKGDDLIDLGYDERQQTFGSDQRDRLSYKDSAFPVVVTLGTPSAAATRAATATTSWSSTPSSPCSAPTRATS